MIRVRYHDTEVKLVGYWGTASPLRHAVHSELIEFWGMCRALRLIDLAQIWGVLGAPQLLLHSIVSYPLFLE